MTYRPDATHVTLRRLSAPLLHIVLIFANVSRLQQRLRFVPWNRDGWKVGHCLTPAIGLPRSLLVLSNNTAIRERFSDILERFWKLFKRKAHLHHYTSVDGFELEMFTTHAESIADLCHQYEVLEQRADCDTGPRLPRLQICS
ncbi:unnamed protein product [Dicrocoelium dendriticum]|nr:unnamed protein product [Dicrocoelium dendriticum]